MKFRKKPVIIDANQWFKNGDHPLDNSQPILPENNDLSEGKLVRYYRTPNLDGQEICKQCGNIMNNHGWIDTLEGGHIVCPGDWIIKGIKGEFYTRKPDIFEQTYEEQS